MPYDERNEESGQFTSTFADEEFIEAVADADDATTTDVADAVGCKYRTAKARLDDLEEAGRVDSRKVGNALLWSLPDGGGNGR